MASCSPALLSPYRGRVVAAAILLAFAGLAARLVQVQGLVDGALEDLAIRQQARREKILARPGDIRDVRGQLLATSITVPSLFVDPSAIEDKPAVARSLAAALGLDAAPLLDRFEKHGDRRFLWIKRHLSQDEARAVVALGWPRHWVSFRQELDRCYPQGLLACHVVGIRDIDSNGRDGVERSLDDVLRGKDGCRIVARDATGKTLAIQEHLTRPAQPGCTVVLTIDSVIQTYAEQALDRVVDAWKPASACAIVMDPRSGAVLAMASRPAFDPSSGQADGPDAWVNRAISDSYEPGSTFKPFIMAAAIDWALVKPDETIDCQQGLYRMGPRTLRSHHPNGLLRPPEIILRSDNIGMARIGERMTNPGLYRAVQSFGFGRPTGIELPGEAAGQVRPLKDWTPYYSTGSIPMGQELAVTPLQLLTAFAALANGGEYLRPRVVRAVIGPDGKPLRVFDQPAVVAHPIRAETAAYMLDPVLRGVVDDPHGTGHRIGPAMVGYSAFGKTGTAQRKGEGGGYAVNRHVSSFLAGAPASRPELVALIVVNDPSVGKTHYGGEVAAPATAEILRRALVYLRVQPDRDVTAAAKPGTREVFRATD